MPFIGNTNIQLKLYRMWNYIHRNKITFFHYTSFNCVVSSICCHLMKNHHCMSFVFILVLLKRKYLRFRYKTHRWFFGRANQNEQQERGIYKGTFDKFFHGRFLDSINMWPPGVSRIGIILFTIGTVSSLNLKFFLTLL